MKTKVCTICHEEKIISQFYADISKSDKHRPSCKTCCQERYDPIKQKQANKKWYKNNKDKVKTYQTTRKSHIKKLRKQYVKNNPEKIKNSILKTVHNITLKEYNKLLKSQKFLCDICKKHQNKFKKAFSVDHNHETNEIRGLLCNECNMGLGIFKDNITSLNNAILYLKRT